MPQNFLACDREQSFLMPPDPRDWLPEGHLSWFILDTVGQLDVAPFTRLIVRTAGVARRLSRR